MHTFVHGGSQESFPSWAKGTPPTRIAKRFHDCFIHNAPLNKIIWFHACYLRPGWSEPWHSVIGLAEPCTGSSIIQARNLIWFEKDQGMWFDGSYLFVLDRDKVKKKKKKKTTEQDGRDVCGSRVVSHTNRNPRVLLTENWTHMSRRPAVMGAVTFTPKWRGLIFLNFPPALSRRQLFTTDRRWKIERETDRLNTQPALSSAQSRSGPNRYRSPHPPCVTQTQCEHHKSHWIWSFQIRFGWFFFVAIRIEI